MPVDEEVEGAQEFVHLRFQRAARHTAQAAAQLQILAAGEVRIKVRLLGDVADAPLEGGEIVVHAAALVEDPALGGLDEAGEHFHRGALPRPVRTQVPEDLARSDGEADSADGGGVIEIFSERAGFEH